MSLIDRAKDYLTSRAGAYRRVFAGSASLVDQRIVLADLAKFCRANESTFHPDPRVAAVQEGRREVWLRLQRHLNLTDEQLLAIYPPKQRI